MTDFHLQTLQKIDDIGLKERASLIFDYLDVSANTKHEYKARIGLFVQFITDEGFDRNSFLTFKRQLANRDDFAVSTKNKYLATARIFLKELYRQGLLPTDITTNIKSFNQSIKHKREGLSHTEIKSLTELIQHLPDTNKNTRLKALFCLLTFQGLRQIELVRLDVKDIDLVAKKAYVQGKGRDDKEAIHLLPQTVTVLKAYLKTNRVSSGALFKGQGNRHSNRITTKTVNRELKSLFCEIGVDKTVHGLRHYYITALLEHFDVRDVRKFSRHKSLEMLIVYDDEIDLGYKSQEVAECFKSFSI